MEQNKNITDEINFYNNINLNEFLNLNKKQLNIFKLINFKNYQKLQRLFDIITDFSSSEESDNLISDEEETYYF